MKHVKGIRFEYFIEYRYKKIKHKRVLSHICYYCHKFDECKYDDCKYVYTYISVINYMVCYDFDLRNII